MDSLLREHIQNPFLRWTGSKRWFIKEHICNFLPNKFNNYHEPFLGSGSVFFYLNSISKKQRKYYLSDTNQELINCYIQLRDNPLLVISYLQKYSNTEDEYYLIRKSNPKSNEKKAARFIYLNRTSFNGIYRVNSLGAYNVPYGKRKNVDVVTRGLLLNTSKILKGTNIEMISFENTLRNIKKNDLVFIDPPYTVAHENNGFIEYNQKLFTWEDQVKLKLYIDAIIKKGAYFILTNANHDSLTTLYDKIGKMHILTRTCKVGGRNKTRGKYNELVVTNIIKAL